MGDTLADYPSQCRASLASSMGLRPGTQAGAIANTKGRSRREFDLILGFEDVKRGTSGTHSPTPLKGPLSEVWLRLGAASSCDIVDLVNLLKGATKLEDLRLAMGCLPLVESLIGHLERDGSSSPRLKLIEALQLSREIRERIKGRRKDLINDIYSYIGLI